MMSKTVRLHTGPSIETSKVRRLEEHVTLASELPPGVQGVEVDPQTGVILSAELAMQREGTTLVVAASEAMGICGSVFKRHALLLLYQPRHGRALRLVLQVLPWYQRLSSAKQRSAATAPASGLPQPAAAAPLVAAGPPPPPPTRAAEAAAASAAAAARTQAEKLLRECAFDFLCGAAQAHADDQPDLKCVTALRDCLLEAVSDVVGGVVEEDSGPGLDAKSVYAEWGRPIEELRERRNLSSAHPWESAVSAGVLSRLFQAYSQAVDSGDVADVAGVPLMAGLSKRMLPSWLKEKKERQGAAVKAVGALQLADWD